MTDDGKERISPEDYSVTLDEMLYLWFLCDGPKTPEQIVDEMASDPTVSKAHHPVTVADRLAYLARDGDTAHFVKRDGERRRLIDDGQAIFC